ncbi:hypothetical protein J437_LFUL005992 [Ladona fulva]|uniref:Uncharacterized protein n=1 Tax=Ladona fulva TaxID=123851 RepID=A0A8K0JZ87_LADFU|nr:hypothetical protein J437_LFUL005992 [Ladona fulva]
MPPPSWPLPGGPSALESAQGQKTASQPTAGLFVGVPQLPPLPRPPLSTHLPPHPLSSLPLSSPPQTSLLHPRISPPSRTRMTPYPPSNPLLPQRDHHRVLRNPVPSLPFAPPF